MQQNVTNDKMYPVMSLVIYKSKNSYSSSVYVESRKLEKTEKGVVMHAPVPLSEDVFESLTKDFKKNAGSEMKHEPIIGSHILTATANPHPCIIWYQPARMIELNFRSNYIKTKERKAWIPACVFMLRKSDLYVYALADDKRPTNETKLFNAPFLNVYEDGRICLGSANVGSKKAETFEKEAERYERGFFMAEQNGGHPDPRKGKTPLNKLWENLIKTGDKFPSKELTPHKSIKTFADLLDKKWRVNNE